MTGNTTLNITGLYNGWDGALKTIQSGNSTTGYLLNLTGFTTLHNAVQPIVMNAGSGIPNLTMLSGAIDVLGFEYDGSVLLTAVGNYFS